MIDLHLHTLASDGLLPPAALVGRARSAGLTTISITDHDTVAGLAEAADASARIGMRVIDGIEITAVENGRDIHILGYFIDPASPTLASFLQDQRQDRVRRVREMAARLADLGRPVDVERLLSASGESGRSVGRPAIADALVAAGHAVDRQDAFARLLGRGQPAFVPRRGASGAQVISLIHGARGVASLAHPGLTNDDALIDVLAAAGLDAIEVWHTDHTTAQREHYGALADRRGLARTGGSDYHGDEPGGTARLGAVTLPATELERLDALAGVR